MSHVIDTRSTERLMLRVLGVGGEPSLLLIAQMKRTGANTGLPC